MMNGQKPEALRLAQALEYCDASVARQAINELRRLHTENASLSTGYDAARHEIDALRARVQELGQMARDCNSRRVIELQAKVQELEEMLAAVGAGGVEPLRKADHFRDATQMVPSDHLRDATKMTLDEAIKHAEEVAGCTAAQCGVEHAQLAAWLRELRDRRVAEMAPVEPTETQKQVVKWLATGSVGKSSKCMAMWLAFGELTEDRFCPADPDDLDRCLKLLDKAPGLRPLIPKMAEVSEKWARLVPRWDEVEASHLAEVGLGWTKARRAPKTYDLMAGILRTEHMRA